MERKKGVSENIFRQKYGLACGAPLESSAANRSSSRSPYTALFWASLPFPFGAPFLSAPPSPEARGRLEWGGGLGHEPKSQLDANRTSGRYRRRRSGKGKRERRGRKAMGSGRMRRAQGGEAALRAVVTSL